MAKGPRPVAGGPFGGRQAVLAFLVLFSQFLGGLLVPTNLNIVMMPPLRGNCLFVIEPSLVFLVIDSMFGGNGRLHTPASGRDFTPTEQRIIQRLLEVVFANYEKSWEPVHPLKCE